MWYCLADTLHNHDNLHILICKFLLHTFKYFRHKPIFFIVNYINMRNSFIFFTGFDNSMICILHSYLTYPWSNDTEIFDQMRLYHLSQHCVMVWGLNKMFVQFIWIYVQTTTKYLGSNQRVIFKHA